MHLGLTTDFEVTLFATGFVIGVALFLVLGFWTVRWLIKKWIQQK